MATLHCPFPHKTKAMNTNQYKSMKTLGIALENLLGSTPPNFFNSETCLMLRISMHYLKVPSLTDSIGFTKLSCSWSDCYSSEETDHQTDVIIFLNLRQPHNLYQSCPFQYPREQPQTQKSNMRNSLHSLC